LLTTPKFRWYKSNRFTLSNDHAVSDLPIFKQIGGQKRIETWQRLARMYADRIIDVS